MIEKNIKPKQSAQATPVTLFNIPLRHKYIFLALIAFVFYANSIPNKYALDDVMTIEQNTYVKRGFRGIPKILTQDSYTGYYKYLSVDKTSKGLSGGRFRPLSEIIFALEQQLFGNATILPFMFHLFNVIAYMLCVLSIYLRL